MNCDDKTRKPVKPFYFDMTDEEVDYFTEESAEILRSGNLILGEYTTRFEQAFAEFVGTTYAIAVNSGSTALEILLQLKKVAGTTVLVPTNTNFATVAAVIRAGGKVQYLDMDEKTFAPTLDIVKDALAKNSSISLVLWVHIAGVISPEFPDVVKYCRQNGVLVLEDAAHAHGSSYKGVNAGNLADGAAFSFFPTKVMTTCEGGMITTNSDEEDYAARSFRNQGKRGTNFGGLHHDFGNSSRMTEMNALLGSIQLKKLSGMLKKRQAAYDLITGHLDSCGLKYVSTRHMNSASQYKLIVLLPYGHSVEQVKRQLAGDGVLLGGGVYEIPCHRQPVFAGLCSGESNPVADRWCPKHICPPLTSGMADQDAEYVGKCLVTHLSGSSDS